MGELTTRIEMRCGPKDATWDWLVIHNPLHKTPRVVGVPKGEATEIACRVNTQPTQAMDEAIYDAADAMSDALITLSIREAKGTLTKGDVSKDGAGPCDMWRAACGPTCKVCNGVGQTDDPNDRFTAYECDACNGRGYLRPIVE